MLEIVRREADRTSVAFEGSRVSGPGISSFAGQHQFVQREKAVFLPGFCAAAVRTEVLVRFGRCCARCDCLGLHAVLDLYSLL